MLNYLLLTHSYLSIGIGTKIAKAISKELFSSSI